MIDFNEKKIKYALFLKLASQTGYTPLHGQIANGVAIPGGGDTPITNPPMGLAVCMIFTYISRKKQSHGINSFKRDPIQE